MPQLLTMESPFPEQHHTLHLLESPDSCQKSLWERLFAATYVKPFIIDSGLQRRLQFGLYTVQSSMHREHPDRLMLAYTRKMMLFLLFNRAPARVLLLGLGGGSLAKFCYRHLPGADITAVEVNSDVIALREAFSIPADDGRFRVICANGADYVARLSRSEDVILADACDSEGVAPELDAIEFYQNARRSLSKGGMFVTNMCGDVDDWARHVAKIREVFGDELMTLQVGRNGNVIVFAFKERHTNIDWKRMAAAAAGLKREFGLDFPRYVWRLSLQWKAGRGQAVFI